MYRSELVLVRKIEVPAFIQDQCGVSRVEIEMCQGRQGNYLSIVPSKGVN